MTDFVSLQPNNRTTPEVGLEQVGTERVDAIPVPIRDMDDPDRIVIQALPFLAWASTVGVWDDEWPDWKKRKATRIAIGLRQRAATLEAYEGWLDLLGAEVVSFVAPPGGCFATQGQKPEERQAYLDQFAQLRITLRRSPGPGDAGTFYASPFRAGEINSYVGRNFAVPGTARLRYGRRATVVDGDTETEVLWATAGIVESDGDVIAIERITVPGRARPTEPFVGRVFAGAHRSFAEPFETTSRILTLGPDRSPQTNIRMPMLNRQANSLEVVSIKPDRVSEKADTAKQPMMVGRPVGGFAYSNTAAERYYDRFYLLDNEQVSAPRLGAGTFVGHSWTEITPFTAQLRVRYPGEASQRAAYVGAFVGMFPVPSSGRLQRIATAVKAGKAARDKIYFTAQTKRIRTLEDGIPLDGSYAFGGHIDIARG